MRVIFRGRRNNWSSSTVTFREIWNDGRRANCCIFQYKMLVVGVKSNLGCEAGCGLTVSWSDHARIIIGRSLQMTFQPFSANFPEILESHFSWQDIW